MNLYEALGRKEVELQTVQERLNLVMNVLKKLKSGEMSLDDVVFDATTRQPEAVSPNGKLPEVEIANVGPLKSDP